MKQFKESLRELRDRSSGSAVVDQNTAQPEPLQEPSGISIDENLEINTYPYQPLQHGKHIRLLFLDCQSPALPSTEDDGQQIISATFHNIELKLDGSSAHQPYRALSYEWGPRPEKNTDLPTINLDGHTIRVRHNLYEALKAIIRAGFDKSSDAPMPLWVDALCINQSDDKEKGHQVDLMRDIFATAEKVLVWLGGIGENAKMANEAMKMLNSHHMNFWEEPGRSPIFHEFTTALSRVPVDGDMEEEIFSMPTAASKPITGFISGLFERILNQLAPQRFPNMTRLRQISCRDRLGHLKMFRMFHGLEALTHAPYWRRVWIIQEFVTASDYVILCGNHFVEKRRFEGVLKLPLSWGIEDNFGIIPPLGVAPSSPAFRLIKLRDKRVKKETTSLPRWVSLYVDDEFGATDPKDYVYALLGISDNCTGRIMADYTRSTKDIYFWATDVIMDSEEVHPNRGRAINEMRKLAEMMGLPIAYADIAMDGLARFRGFQRRGG